MSSLLDNPTLDALIPVVLDNVGKQIGIIDLGGVFTAFNPGSNSSDFVDKLLECLKQVETQLTDIQKQIDSLESEITALYVDIQEDFTQENYNTIKTAFTTMAGLDPSDSNCIGEIAANMQGSYGAEAVYDACLNLNDFVSGDAETSNTLMNGLSKSLSDNTFTAYFISMKSAFLYYMTAFQRAEALFQWWNAANSAGVGSFTDGPEYLTTSKSWQTNLINTFNRYIPLNVQEIYSALASIKAPSSNDTPSFYVNGMFPADPKGVPIKIRALSHQDHFVNAIDESQSLTHSNCCYALAESPMTFRLCPCAPLSTASTSGSLLFTMVLDDPSSYWLKPEGGENFMVGYTGEVAFLSVWQTQGIDIHHNTENCEPSNFHLYYNPPASSGDYSSFTFKWYNQISGIPSTLNGLDKDLSLETHYMEGYEMLKFKDAGHFDRTVKSQQFYFEYVKS